MNRAALEDQLRTNLEDFRQLLESNRKDYTAEAIADMEAIIGITEDFIACLECEADLRERGIDASACRTCKGFSKKSKPH